MVVCLYALLAAYGVSALCVCGPVGRPLFFTAKVLKKSK